MNILGLNHGEINSSAAIIKDGIVLASAPEERFNRQKKTKAFPFQAIQYCLQMADINLEDCDYVAQAWNPGATWVKFNPFISQTRIRREDYFYTIPDNLYRLTQRTPQDWLLMHFPEGSHMPPLYFIQHHKTHAAHAFYLSPFAEAAILTCDWKGELECTTLGIGRGNRIDTLHSQLLPHSLGLFYATFTELLGFRPDNDEWKVMALSAFDVDYQPYLQRIKKTYRLREDGFVEFDQTYYKGTLVDQPKLYTPHLVNLLGGREGTPGAEPDEWYMAVAKAMQLASEEIALHFLQHLFEQTRCHNVVLGGGFFMNCVFNGKVQELSPFEEVYIPYAPADLGNSMGAALYVAHHLHDEPRQTCFNSSYLGPSFTDEMVEYTLQRRKIPYRVLAAPPTQTAELLAQGNIVAVFNGRMEFGERALGNRSILADPRQPNMRDRINRTIKYRENFRPFAPATLYEKAPLCFDVPPGYQSNHMEKVTFVREPFRKQLPAITHIDGSARLQTVQQEHNPTFYAIITEFEKITGYPVVLNTSFNLNGEPIVLSPDDALNTFYNSGLEYLVMGKYLIEK